MIERLIRAPRVAAGMAKPYAVRAQHAVAARAVRAASYRAGFAFGQRLAADPTIDGYEGVRDNPLYAYFEANVEGPGIWKPHQYFKV